MRVEHVAATCDANDASNSTGTEFGSELARLERPLIGGVDRSRPEGGTAPIGLRAAPALSAPYGWRAAFSSTRDPKEAALHTLGGELTLAQ